MLAILGRVVGFAGFFYHRVQKFSRRGKWPLTIGVRIIVCNHEQGVLLVRHTYAPGWHFPGGAVDPRETVAQAAVRELREEALIDVIGEPALSGVFLNLTENKSDHIAVFTAREWQAVEGNTRALEIAEAKFFPVDALPTGTTGGTRRRLAEFLGGVPLSPFW